VLRFTLLTAAALGWIVSAAPVRAFDESRAMRESQAAIGRTVRDVEFVTSAGQPVRLDAFRGRPVVISMIYTSCAGVCPATTRQLALAVRVARGALGNDGFTVISVGFDTVHDTAQALRDFAGTQHVGDAHWLFVSAAPEQIAQLSADTGFWFAPGSGIFDHLVQTTLLDASGRVVLQLYGNEFRPLDLAEPLRKAVVGAPIATSSGPSVLARVRLLCTVFDPRLGRYRTDYSLALSLAIAITTLAGLLVSMSRAWRSAGR